jgi:cyclomaltodextrinase
MHVPPARPRSSPFPHLLAALMASAAAAGAGAACVDAAPHAAPLFVRGAMNSWGVADAYKLAWQCDAYYLNVDLHGSQQFKIGDAAWSATSTYGPYTLDFAGEQTLTVRFAQGAPHLTLGARSYRDPDTAVPDQPVARSLAHDSRRLADKAPFGAVKAGSTVLLQLNAMAGVSAATLVVERRTLEGNQEVLEYAPLARLPMQRQQAEGGERWSAHYRFDDTGVYGYYFEVSIAGKRYLYQNNAQSLYWTRERGVNGLGAAQAVAPGQTIRRFRQSVYAPDFTVPAWARDAVYYYVFPERFRNGDRSNDPVPGLTGFHDKRVEFHQDWLGKPYRPHSGDGSDALDNNDFFGGDLQGLIDKLDYIAELGANTLYLTPVFKAASNHKYDTGDYRNIDPHFGSNADYTRLTTEAARRGMRVIADASFNHTGSDSIYFDRYANYTGRGAFRNARIDPASPYADWYLFDASQREPGRQFKGWGGTVDLPELNKASPSYRQFAYGAPDSITRLWLQRGAAGWRMDVAPWVPDDFWRAWRKVVKAERADALTIAETWFDASKFLLGDSFDSTMNYIFRDAVLDYANGASASVSYAAIEMLREAYPPQAFFALMNLLSSHDQPRSLYVLGDHGDRADRAASTLARRRLRLALFFQMMFPGAPAVYYGDEVGLNGGGDPLNRATYPWADLGGAPDSALLADVKALIAMRRAHPVLRHGSIEAPLLVDQHVVVLARRDGANWAICATNNAATARSVEVSLPAGAPDGVYTDALDGSTARAEGGRLRLRIPALFGTVMLASAP